MGYSGNSKAKIVTGSAGYVLEDVPHLTDYILDLPYYPNPLQNNPAYSVVKQYFVNDDDTVAQKIVVHKSSPRGIHFRRAGPRQRVYFESDDVHACIVTCGGLCPGLNTVIREIVCGLYDMYGVKKISGIDGGYKGFYARNTIPLSPRVVNNIYKHGGTILCTSRGGHDISKIVDIIQDRGINQVCTRSRHSSISNRFWCLSSQDVHRNSPHEALKKSSSNNYHHRDNREAKKNSSSNNNSSSDNKRETRKID